MSALSSAYKHVINRVLRPKLLALGFSEVRLKDCISYEALFRKDDLWFGTSWDWRDRYLELDIGHLYWLRDVMPRVVIAGNYASFSSRVKRVDADASDYLEQIAHAVAESLEVALAKYQASPELGDSKLSRLRQHIIGRVGDSELKAHEA
jgi:hypothetical protein